ncbi:MAG: hypothetical protein JNM12_09935 [Alphaproteobacteria bacterium]|nr:hypothetical protein [Alphaproteobacteria bacterium]
MQKPKIKTPYHRNGVKIYEISGPRGCGKTTEARRIRQEEEAKGLKVFIDEGGEISQAAFDQLKPDVLIVTKI